MAVGPKRILLIDNDEAVCRMVEAILSDGGYAVSAHTGANPPIASSARV